MHEPVGILYTKDLVFISVVGCPQGGDLLVFIHDKMIRRVARGMIDKKIATMCTLQ